MGNNARSSNNVKTQRRLMKQTQKRINSLIRQVQRMRSQITKRANDNDVFEDFMTRTIAGMITQGLTMSSFTNGITTTVAAPKTTDAELGAASICTDIRGKDRACCNTAVRCFDDVTGHIDDLQRAPEGSFSLMSACRQVGSDLKKDRQCVQQSLSRCRGPGRAILQSRFDSRLDTLYDQYYKHCTKRDTDTTTQSQPIPVTTSPLLPSPVTTTPGQGLLPTAVTSDHRGRGHNTGHNTRAENNDMSTSGAIIAGAIAGGAILLIVLMIAIILWCRNKRDRNASDRSSSGSSGVFFQKRPNMFSTERQHGNNNHKHGATREDSSIYAEIDEGLVNPNYKPPVPDNAGYIHAVSDTDPGITNSISSNIPTATTRGQLSYGPILAANRDSGSGNALFYHSTSVVSPSDLQKPGEQGHYMGSGDETLLSHRNLLSSTNTDRTDNAYVLCDSAQSSDPDDYEEPISAHSSLHYAELDKRASPPDEYAPVAPAETKANKGPHQHSAIKVLPSNPLVSPSANRVSLSPDPTTPKPKPRRKNLSKSPETELPHAGKQSGVDQVKNLDLSNRDSMMSTTSSNKSSHHYFVLERETDLDYENSVSPPKIV